jgi:structure-specific endonuclease subunit SLX1
MIMIVHNFPDMTSALRFEWAWQQPKGSTRLKQIESIQKKKRGESNFSYHFRILTELINVGPWNRLGLKIRWFENSYTTSFPPDRFPTQMEICFGPIRIKKPKASQALTQEQLMQQAIQSRTECNLCLEQISDVTNDRVFCTNNRCKLIAHIRCLAKLCLQGNGHYVPTHGDCPLCDTKLIWGDVIRKKKGYHVIEEFDDEEFDI